MIAEKIKEILCEIKEDPSLMTKIQENTHIINEIGLDSLQMINLVLVIEDEFKVEIDFEKFDFSYFNSIKKLADFVQESINNSSSK